MTTYQPSLIENEVPTKRCSMCAADLPITLFSYHKYGKYQRASQCRACLRVYKKLPHVQATQRAYRQRNYDRDKAQRKNLPSQQPEAKKAHNKQYKGRNKERIAAYRRTLKAKESIRIGKMRYRARLTQAKGDFTKEQFYERCEYYGWRCYLCNLPLTLQTVIIEHRIPLSRGGTNWPANLAPCCRSCNSRKHNKTEKEYRIELQRGGVA